jgi:16S rRNA (adenine1518-N6/adenine1519-N6)-dimethyltransferase
MSPRRLGQHFLASAIWRARIVEALALRPEDTWLEIGAGAGEMTCELAPRVGRLVAIELDERLVEKLRRATAALENVEVVAGDVLALDLERLGGPQFKVYGNLPYYITSPILHRLFEAAEWIEEIAVVIQLEVADRLAARPGRRAYGYLSVLAQFYARPEILFRIPPGAFRPAPRVSSALVRMRMEGERQALGIDREKAFLAFVQAAFAQKRKTVLNNLRAFLPAAEAARVLSEAKISSRARAERLTIGQLAELYRRSQAPAERR